MSDSPTDVRTVWCPFCNADPGQLCLGTRPTRNGVENRRERNHRERVQAYIDRRRTVPHRNDLTVRKVLPNISFSSVEQSPERIQGQKSRETATMPVIKKTPVRTAKKPVPAKSTKAPAKKAASSAPPAKRPVGRPRKVTEAPVVKSTRTGKAVAEVPQTKKPNPRQKVNGYTLAELSELTGLGMGTQSFIIAVELIRGGTDRREILGRVRELLPPETRNGTPKMVSNLVGNVIKILSDRGFVVQGSWSMVKP